MSVPLALRPIASEELGEAYRLLSQLRPHLDETLFRERLARQAERGYALLGAFDPALVAILGMRPVETLARGPHLHIDDLVVDAARRNEGIGAQLLAHAEALAWDRGLGAVFLDSRVEAMAFYRRAGYQPHTAILVRKMAPPESGQATEGAAGPAG